MTTSNRYAAPSAPVAPPIEQPKPKVPKRSLVALALLTGIFCAIATLANIRSGAELRLVLRPMVICAAILAAPFIAGTLAGAIARLTSKGRGKWAFWLTARFVSLSLSILIALILGVRAYGSITEAIALRLD